MNDHKREQLSLLTAREKRVLELVVKAQTNKEIAAALGISPSTVKRHLESIFNKLHVQNRVGAAVYAMEVGEELRLQKTA